jgi:hypothetical protein
MSVISATSSSAYGSVASLLVDAASSVTDDLQPDSAASSDTKSSGDPADIIDLSDRAKQVLAQSKIDQVAADTLSALVQSLRAAGKPQPLHSSFDKAQASSSGGKPVSFEELAGISLTSTTEVKVTAGNPNAASTDANGDTPPSGTILPKRSFSETLSFNGFHVTATGNALTNNSDVQIYGPDGSSASSTLFGGSAGVGSGGAGKQYTMVSSAKVGNRQIFTFAMNSAAVSATAAQNASGSAVQATAAVKSCVVTFVVDFNTGKISAMESDASAAATLSAVQRTA